MSTYSNFYLEVGEKVFLDRFFFQGKDTDDLNHKHLDAKRRSEIDSYTNFFKPVIRN